MPNVKFVARDFMGMVANLPALKIDVLYESIWTCQAIFRYTHFTYNNVVITYICIRMLLNFGDKKT